MYDASGRRVTVMGLGRFGGGVGVTRWLAEQGADVLVTDLEPEERLKEPVEAIRSLVDSGRVTLRLGGHNVSDFTTCDLVVANPAVPKPWENRFLRAATAAGIPITTEIELVVQRLDRRRVIGVTGSAGKSTTAALIAHILRECGEPVLLGGNIGGSLLGALAGDEATKREPWVVLELSSAMLHWLHAWSPHIAVVTNISDNHKDWHGTFEHYLASKQIIVERQQPGDAAVLGSGASDWWLPQGVKRTLVKPNAVFGPLSIPGRHNQVNAAMASAAAMSLGIEGLTEDQIRRAAATFPGLPHRLQFVGEAREVRFYNDSKSTTPESTGLALDAFADQSDSGWPTQVHLIAGGYDKGADLRRIWHNAELLRGLYTIGATGDSIADGAAEHGQCCVRRCGTLEGAVDDAVTRAKPGDVILLSPGCASWDQFENYEKRGERFVELAKKWIDWRQGVLA